MKNRDFDRIRFVTRHFNDLQGLRYWVPLGMITLSVGGNTYFTSWPMLVLRAWLLVGAFLLIAGARRYYRTAFGEVESQALFAVPVPELESLSIYSSSGSLPLLSGSRTGAPVARRFVVGLGLALALGASLLGLAALGATLGSFYPGVGGSFRIVAFLAPAVLHLWFALLLCGGSMILAGLLDHWQLVRALGRPAGRREEGRG